MILFIANTATASHPVGTFGTIVNYEVSNREFRGSYVDPNTGDTVTMTVNILSHAVEIFASDCILERTCGLCGTSDRDSSNDIHVRIGDTNSFNILSTSNEDRHEFGDSWCNEEITQIYGDGNCTQTDPNTVFQPTNPCVDAAIDCCSGIWNMSCEANCATSELDFEDWVDHCAFDSCAYSDNTIQDDTCGHNIANNYFDDSISLCQDFCEPPSAAPTQAPTDFDCDNTRECWIKNDPHITTWDELRYDYHGVGYFDYFAPCNKDDYSLATGVPFRVTIRQRTCTSTGAACVYDTFITIVDGTTTTTIRMINIPGTGMCNCIYTCVSLCILFCFLFAFCDCFVIVL